MTLSFSTVKKLLQLVNGESLADSLLKGEEFVRFKDERQIVCTVHGSRKSWKAYNPEMLRSFIADAYNIPDLEDYSHFVESGDDTRAYAVKVSGNSKESTSRVFTGFLVNCYTPIHAKLSEHEVTICPVEGTYTFVHDYLTFEIPPEVIVVGIENSENFRLIRRQREFFERNISSSAPLLFVSRYPQNQHKDLIGWLRQIPNRYVHFGDLDIAGIGIYLYEFFKHLPERAEFLIPKDFDERVARGSAQRYNVQNDLRPADCEDRRLLPLLDAIHRYHRGYDQEGFIV